MTEIDNNEITIDDFAKIDLGAEVLKRIILMVLTNLSN